MPFRKPGEGAAYYLANKDRVNATSKRYRENARLTKPWIKLLQNVRQRAAAKGLECDLTPEWAEARWTGFCELSGLPFDVTPSGSGPRAFSPSIDRIDAVQGYLISNCRIILFGINAMKGPGSDEDLLTIARALVDRDVNAALNILRSGRSAALQLTEIAA